jgi:hypothetical protein
MRRFINAIFAMAALVCIACENELPYDDTSSSYIPSLATPPNNEIWFVTTDARDLRYIDTSAFDVAVEDILYSEMDKNIIRFAAPLTTIGEGAFRSCKNLHNISLPDSVVKIEEEAFYECTGMECMTLGNGLRYCGPRAFDNCLNIYTLHVPSIWCWCQIEFANPTSNPTYYSQTLVINGKKVTSLELSDIVESVKPYAFYNNTAITSVSVAASVKSFGTKAFEGCDNIKKVAVADIAAWCATDFANETANPLSIAGALYMNGNKVTALTLDGISEIKSQAFIRCTSIQSLIAKDIVGVGTEAFRACPSLKEVTLGAKVNEISGRAFMGCSLLESVTIKNPNPPTLGDEYVFDYNAEGRKIHIPWGSYDLYVMDPIWMLYADSLEGI